MEEIRSWKIFDGFLWREARPRLSWQSYDAWTGSARSELEAHCEGYDDEVQQWHERLRHFGGEPSRMNWSRFRPLRFEREEDWSDWLAHLLEASTTGELARRLLGPTLAPKGTDYKPTRAEREVTTPNRTSRADIVLEWPSGARTSIEVKVGDLNLDKTDDTAAGVGATWSAILLLREDVAAWERGAGSGSRTSVRTWDDVARALRSALWNGGEPVTWGIWAAAYLGKIEQELLRLPVEVVRERAESLQRLVARNTRLNLMREARNHG